MRPPTSDEPRVEIGVKRVRAVVAGHVVGDTRSPRLVWAKPSYPTYYFPSADVDDGEPNRETGQTRA